MVRRVMESTPFRRLRDRARWMANMIRFGRSAPKPNERLWIDPSDVRYALGGVPVRSGRVVDDWPPVDPVPFDEHVHVRFALAHWRDGMTWEQTGAFDYMLDQISRRGRQDGCFDLDDVKRRYERLDELFETVRREGRLRTQSELDPSVHDEDGGIFVHIGPDGEPAIGDSGKHRLTIARLVGLSVVPARIGYVHREALPLLPELRRPASAGGATSPSRTERRADGL